MPSNASRASACRRRSHWKPDRNHRVPDAYRLPAIRNSRPAPGQVTAQPSDVGNTSRIPDASNRKAGPARPAYQRSELLYAGEVKPVLRVVQTSGGRRACSRFEKKLPVLTLSADGAVTAWNAEWDAALGKADWSGLQLPLARLIDSKHPAADDLEFDLHPLAPGRRRALFQPAFAADGSLMQWRVHLLPLPSGRSDQELIGNLPLRTLGLPQLPLSMKATYREFVQKNFLVSIAGRLLALDIAGLFFLRPGSTGGTGRHARAKLHD